MNEPGKISSARARAVEAAQIGPLEVKQGPSYFHVNVRQPGAVTPEAIEDVAAMMVDWLKERRA